MPGTLVGRDFLRETDFTREEFLHVLDLASALKAARSSRSERPSLTGKNIALIFEKPSTRTRISFEVAAHDQGARTTFLDSSSTHVGVRESIRNTARVLDRLYDGIQYRGFSQDRVETLARYSTVPVWNGMTNEWHPTQMLGDMLTMRENSKRSLSDLRIAYIGNGYNNITNSLLITCAMFGSDIRIVSPFQLATDTSVVAEAKARATDTGARMTLTDNIREGLVGADYVYTDSWLSMHEDSSSWAGRLQLLRPYRVTRALLEQSANDSVKLLHCMPAYYSIDNQVSSFINEHFGDEELEVTEEVFESEYSLAFHQAENRMHTIKALMVATLTG